MTTTNYINSNGLGLKVTQLPSGTFDLYFSNGFISTCYTEDEFGLCFLKTYKIMRTIKSVIIVTNAGQVEGVFTSFRALSQSNGVSHINIEGVYETYTETELKDIFAMGKHFQYFGMKCKIMVMPVNQ